MAESSLPRLAELRELIRCRFLLFFRDREAVFWVFAFPLILSIVLGFAFSSTSVKPSRIGVPAGPEGDVMAEVLEGSEVVEVVRYDDLHSARRRVARGAFDALVKAGTPPVIRFDPARPDGALARHRVLEAWHGSRGETPPASIREEKAAETGSRYLDYLFPGLLGLNLLSTSLWSIGLSIADHRQKKLLKRMLVTPMRRSSFLLTFIAWRLLFMVLEVVILVCFGVFVLGVPFAGSLSAFALIVTLSTVSFAGLGLLVAARTKTLEGVTGLLNFVLIPMWLFAGIFFPYERFPEFLHPVIQWIPLTALIDALRALMLDGAGLVNILPEIGIISAWGIVCFLTALKIFRWT